MTLRYVGIVAVHRCRACDLYRETRRAMKYGNETQRRAGHWRYAQICESCAYLALVEPKGFDSLGNRWRIHGLREAWKIEER